MPAATPDFERVFAEHSAFAWRVLARSGVREGDVEDVCQEVFLVVHSGLAGFEGRSSLKTWIYGICRRVAANYRNRASHRRELVSESPTEVARGDASDTTGDAFEALARKQSLSLLDELLAQLSDEQREVFVLYEVEQLTMREIAAALQCSQNTAFARLYAARREIAAGLKRVRARRVA